VPPYSSLCVALTYKDFEQKGNVLDGSHFGFQVNVFASGGSVVRGLLSLVPRCTCFPTHTRDERGGGDLNLMVIRCDTQLGGKRANFDYS
jgi:hypothetical protein